MPRPVRSTEDIGDFGDGAGRAMRQPFAGHRYPIAEGVESGIVDGYGRLQIEDDHRPWGCTAISTGYTEIGSNSNYPPSRHPDDHHFSRSRSPAARFSCSFPAYGTALTFTLLGFGDTNQAWPARTVRRSSYLSDVAANSRSFQDIRHLTWSL